MAVATGRAFLIQPCFSSSLCSLPKNIKKSSYGAADVFCMPYREALLAHQLWFMPNSDPDGFLGLILHHILMELWLGILGSTHLALVRIRKVACAGRVVRARSLCHGWGCGNSFHRCELHKTRLGLKLVLK